MRHFCQAGFGLWLCGLLALAARADTFQMADGQPLSGDIVSYDDSGLILRLPDDTYTGRLPWTKFSQDDLKRLAKNPKLAQLVEPFVEITETERVKKPVIEVKEVTRLEHPAKRSLFGAMASSSVGAIVLLLLYAANLYAAYEIALFRFRPFPVVVGVAAVLPVLGPIIFLAMPTHGEVKEAAEPRAEPEAAPATYAIPGMSPPKFEVGTGSPYTLRTPTETGSSSFPPLQIFQRGQYTFNRRFFETKFSGFFGIVRGAAEKDLVFTVKTMGGEFVVRRITRLAANDIHFEVLKGGVSQEVMVPFAEIQEIWLKHKDA